MEQFSCVFTDYYSHILFYRFSCVFTDQFILRVIPHMQGSELHVEVMKGDHHTITRGHSSQLDSSRWLTFHGSHRENKYVHFLFLAVIGKYKKRRNNWKTRFDRFCQLVRILRISAMNFNVSENLQGYHSICILSFKTHLGGKFGDIIFYAIQIRPHNYGNFSCTKEQPVRLKILYIFLQRVLGLDFF